MAVPYSYRVSDCLAIFDDEGYDSVSHVSFLILLNVFQVLVVVVCLVFIQNVISDDPEEHVLPPTADDYNYDDRNVDDLEPAESMVFRPMFAYRKMMERRKKWQEDNSRRRNPYYYQ